jgi:hypothetical protein
LINECVANSSHILILNLGLVFWSLNCETVNLLSLPGQASHTDIHQDLALRSIPSKDGILKNQFSYQSSRHFSSSFTLIRAHTNFHDHRTTPSGREAKRKEREKEKKINEFSGHYVCHVARLQRCTGSARTSLDQHFRRTVIVLEWSYRQRTIIPYLKIKQYRMVSLNYFIFANVGVHPQVQAFYPYFQPL